MGETEHTCQFCYYEYFDSRAYPCSMCVCGEERKDMFQPKGRQNKRKDEPQTEPPHACKTCPYHERCSAEDWRTCHWDYVSERYIEPQTERSK